MTVSATQSNMDVRSHKNKGIMKQEELRKVNLGEEVFMHQYFLAQSLYVKFQIRWSYRSVFPLGF